MAQTQHKTGIHPLTAPICAMALAAGIALAATIHRRQFDEAEMTSYKKTDRYDDRFITLVNHLERDLAQRAGFGYRGGMDPVTGRSRRLVNPVPQQEKAPPPASRGTVSEEPAPDPVRLTAIIFDDRSKSYTAIVMDGERSYSVNAGDQVRGRTVKLIAADRMEMADDKYMYTYDIYGRKSRKPREMRGVLGLLESP